MSRPCRTARSTTATSCGCSRKSPRAPVGPGTAHERRRQTPEPVRPAAANPSPPRSKERTMTEVLSLGPGDDRDRFARFRLISWWEQERLTRARVLVLGVGALGNEILKNLALLGIGRVFLADLDRVEDANLSRSVLFREEDRGRPKVEAAAQ